MRNELGGLGKNITLQKGAAVVSPSSQGKEIQFSDGLEVTPAALTRPPDQVRNRFFTVRTGWGKLHSAAADPIFCLLPRSGLRRNRLHPAWHLAGIRYRFKKLSSSLPSIWYTTTHPNKIRHQKKFHPWMKSAADPIKATVTALYRGLRRLGWRNVRDKPYLHRNRNSLIHFVTFLFTLFNALPSAFLEWQHISLIPTFIRLRNAIIEINTFHFTNPPVKKPAETYFMTDPDSKQRLIITYIADSLKWSGTTGQPRGNIINIFLSPLWIDFLGRLSVNEFQSLSTMSRSLWMT